MKCARCDMPNDDAAQTCVQCGALLHNPDGTVVEKQPTSAKQKLIGILAVLILIILVVGRIIGFPIWVWLVVFVLAIGVGVVAKAIND